MHHLVTIIWLSFFKHLEDLNISLCLTHNIIRKYLKEMEMIRFNFSSIFQTVPAAYLYTLLPIEKVLKYNSL